MQSVVSTKGQTVVPKEIREALNLKPGTRLVWIVRDGAARVIPIPADPVRALRGLLKGHGTYEGWLAERNTEREYERQLEEREDRARIRAR
jgi:AbrB family looped-hinge helix DNA binding protein